jgi:hypothetical protein
MKDVICPICCWTGEVSRIDKPCPACGITGAELPLIPKYPRGFSRVRKKGKMIFEVYGHQLGSEILITDTEKEALAIARSYGMHWRMTVQLYRVPYVKTSGPLWDADDIQFVAEIENKAS